MSSTDEDYDEFNRLLDTDPIRLRDIARSRDRECKAWANGVADFVEPMGFDREAACGPADLLPGLKFMRGYIECLLNALDHRAATGDAEPYYQARHDLEMALGSRTCSECDGLGWVHVPGHGCNGDERLCAEMCPEPVQMPCPSCREPVRATTSSEDPF